jgi:hypothetical protein
MLGRFTRQTFTDQALGYARSETQIDIGRTSDRAFVGLGIRRRRVQRLVSHVSRAVERRNGIMERIEPRIVLAASGNNRI